MYKYFKPEELKCKCGKCESTGHEMDVEFMRKLDALREHLNFPLVITSAYRCPTHNKAVSVTGTVGPHTTGKAVDISISHKQAYELIKAAPDFGFLGIGIQQKGSGRYIHLDTIDGEGRPTIWSY